jgi:nitrate reductase cytochrome c-type subunit
VLVAKANRELDCRKQRLSMASGAQRIAAARCFQMDREILAAAHPWDCVLSALYELRAIQPETEK